jgi:hypothetical protein
VSKQSTELWAGLLKCAGFEAEGLAVSPVVIFGLLIVFLPFFHVIDVMSLPQQDSGEPVAAPGLAAWSLVAENLIALEENGVLNDGCGSILAQQRAPVHFEVLPYDSCYPHQWCRGQLMANARCCMAGST